MNKSEYYAKRSAARAKKWLRYAQKREGKVRYGLAMWLLGMPLPIILIALFVKGCDW